MRVRMLVAVSGTRSGADWPPVGGVLECDDGEGRQLCAAGIAVPAPEPAVETRPAPTVDVETRHRPGRPRRA